MSQSPGWSHSHLVLRHCRPQLRGVVGVVRRDDLIVSCAQRLEKFTDDGRGVLRQSQVVLP